MNKSAIFKAAHKLVKLIIQAGDNYAATFSACLKATYEELKMKTQSIADQVLKVGGKIWEKAEMKRIYMTCDQFNQVTGKEYRLSDSNNKFFYDYTSNAIFRSYKGKKPTVEVQY